MTNTVNKLLTPFLLLIIFIMLVCCATEKKFAREFIRYDSTRKVMVIPPDFIYKTSLKNYEVKNAGKLNWWELDSVLYENSIFLQYIWDTAFINDYYNAYCDELKNLGYEVFDPGSTLQFLSGSPDAYIFNLAQLELEEYVIPVVEEEEFNDQLYYQIINLNAISVNSWIEISSLNDEENNELVFSSLFLTDEVTGEFVVNYVKNEVNYKYHMDSLHLEEVYQLGDLAGYLYAGYTFDYFMNLHIDKRRMECDKRRTDTYYHFNRRGRYLSVADTNARLIPLD